MSKIAEIEEYPRHVIGGNNPYNRGYNAGYDQAMQDFLEKAEKFLERHKRLSNVSFDEDFIPFFKEQMMED